MRKDFHVIVTQHLILRDWECDELGNPRDTETMFDECVSYGDIISTVVEEVL